MNFINSFYSKKRIIFLLWDLFNIIFLIASAWLLINTPEKFYWLSKILISLLFISGFFRQTQKFWSEIFNVWQDVKSVPQYIQAEKDIVEETEEKPKGFYLFLAGKVFFEKSLDKLFILAIALQCYGLVLYMLWTSNALETVWMPLAQFIVDLLHNFSVA